MNLDYTAEEEVFREEVRDFLDRELTAELREYAKRMTSVYSNKETALAWQAILAEQGWTAPAWPVKYGGCDWTVAQRYIFSVELAIAGAPPLSPMGIAMCGPALIGHGTDEQKAHYLPRILSGEDFWCQGYSEPHAGSDLAQLSMSADVDGSDFVCNGSKIWTTHAHESNMMFCLVRTDTSGRPQQGITFILIDMASPGVSVDPITMLSGEHIQNTVFFNDVRVPKANVVGKIDEGWTVAKYLLEFERGGSSYGPHLKVRLQKLRAIAAEQSMAEIEFFTKLSHLEIAVMALDASERRLLSELSAGGSPGLKASEMKIVGTELSQEIGALFVELSGAYAAPYQPHHTFPGGDVLNAPPKSNALVGAKGFVTATPYYFNDRAGSIYAGSNEIQRNILAKAQLKL